MSSTPRKTYGCRTQCPVCEQYFTKGMYRHHSGSGECSSFMNMKKCRAEGLMKPSDMNVAVNTVQMLAEHAGMKLERRMVAFADYGTKWEGMKDENEQPLTSRYMEQARYVAPVWLCKVADLWRNEQTRRRREKAPKLPHKIPKEILSLLSGAAKCENKRTALITHIKLKVTTL